MGSLKSVYLVLVTTNTLTLQYETGCIGRDEVADVCVCVCVCVCVSWRGGGGMGGMNVDMVEIW